MIMTHIMDNTEEEGEREREEETNAMATNAMIIAHMNHIAKDTIPKA